jgi:hypothetical protein
MPTGERGRKVRIMLRFTYRQDVMDAKFRRTQNEQDEQKDQHPSIHLMQESTASFYFYRLLLGGQTSSGFGGPVNWRSRSSAVRGFSKCYRAGQRRIIYQA